ncbi:dol-P-Man:Man(7)GlcNAc(2)-PP-Dol alpha-1,6-mannosyltransferase-like isoform X2 [Liolophura sinensis]|uniref:dol-P-Man:Man(7)GlcNAc(2)-PP-Dol alpha-1,6-mannosyltransferase-like isoform X2 n=1 Tax=Liolophura sinensis TaxID=3198878 RepID=UPI003159296B
MVMVTGLDFAVLVVMLLHLLVCPYTKYDHLEFPGVVPRSFLGPFVISTVSAPLVWTARLFGASKFFSQIVVRACLGFYVLMGFRAFCTAIQSNFGRSVKRWMLLLTVTQFHLLFYMTRPLPNVMALGLVFLALSYWLRQRYGRFIWTSGIAIIVFRAELALFLGLILFMELMYHRVSIFTLLRNVFPAGAVVLVTTFLVDSIFWKRWLWPEGEVLWFNVVLNKSADYGTSPFLWYFYSAIPRALSCSTLLIPVGFYFDRRLLTLLFPALGFVFLYSFLPHKELRFIIYTFPVLNIAASCAMSRIWLNRSKTPLQWVTAHLVACHLFVNVFISVCFLYVSSHNYPGGVAMHRLHELAQSNAHSNSENISVHIDVYTAQTGVSRFTQLESLWQYNKTEDLPPGGEAMKQFSWLLIGANSEKSKSVLPYSATHEVVAKVEGYNKLQLAWTSVPPFKVITGTKIIILKKRNIT